MEPKFKGVLFDLDGTLINTYDLIYASMRHTMDHFLDWRPTDEELMAGVGTPLEAQMIHFAGGDEAKGALMTDFYREHNHSVHDELIADFPGVMGMLQALADAGVRMAVVTSKRHALAMRGCACFGIERYLEFLIGPDDCPLHKPDPAPVALGCQRLGLDPAECLYVGDSPFDIQAGNGAGCATFAALWGMFPAEQLLACEPTFTGECAADLQALVLGAK
ncbi:MAG: HAD-IA family hydrolase [Coriobacteriia bacterium]|nr:HAD-IA family hydrolase [Coriobacteriia bacterium]